MYIAVYIGLTSREYDDVMRQIWATCDACFQYQMWKRSNYTLYSLKEFLTWRFFMSPLLSHHDMRLVCMYVHHLLQLDNLISTLFEHLNILWFIVSIYYLLLFAHLCPLYGMNNKLSSKLGMLADAAKHFLLCVSQQSIVLYFCSRLHSFIIFIHDL